MKRPRIGTGDFWSGPDGWARIFTALTFAGASWHGIEDRIFGGPPASFDPHLFVLWATLVAIIRCATFACKQIQASRKTALATERLAQRQVEEDRKSQRDAIRQAIDTLGDIEGTLQSELIVDSMSAKNRRQLKNSNFKGRPVLAEKIQNRRPSRSAPNRNRHRWRC